MIAPPSRIARLGAGLAVAFLATPLLALVVRAPWQRLIALSTSATAQQALRLSAMVAVTATLLALAAGLPLAVVLARGTGRGTAAMRALVLVPLVLPPVVAGVALLAAFGRRGLVGALLWRLGWQLPFSTAGAALAATFVALPLTVLVLEAGFRSLDPRLEQAALAMGASKGVVLRRVTLPLLGPHLLAASGLAFARALGEFGATITFAGNLQGRTQTLPLAAFELLQTDPGGAILLSLWLLALSTLAVLVTRGRLAVR
jgi:molybdate transport system permease protein